MPSGAGTSRRLTCDECGELVVDYVDGDLDAAGTKRLMEHIGGRDRCERCVESYKRTSTLCGKAFSAEPSPEFGQKLMTFLQKSIIEKDG